MITREFQELQLSMLGFGAMRLPVIDGQAGVIDETAVREMVSYAMAHGVNYYDTAWGYHEGQSEVVMGRVLRDYPRESFCLATKFPSYDPTNITERRGPEIFERQLEKCQVDFFDFYLCHNVNSANIDPYLSGAGRELMAYFAEQKANGRIRHLGFSVHGDYDVMTRFLEAYGEYIEFGQVQLNWVDYDFQEARRKVELLDTHGIPIWVMEPLRGGRLATLPGKYEEKLRALRPDESVAAWAFRFLQTIPHVGMILSGMSDMDQLRKNIEIFATEKPLSPTEWDGLMEVAEVLKDDKTVPCTECRYCTGDCPQGLDIPRLIHLYNDNALTGRDLSVPAWMLGDLPEGKRPTDCIGCKTCETLCPQGIPISEVMARFGAAIVEE